MDTIPMHDQELKKPGPEKVPPQPTPAFFPAGAIAFFILLVALCLVIWFGIYFLMIQRS
ncbi:MAG: cytochrome c oxidase subunit 2A [Gemmatimonadaceae bacterium]|nr:cytochrome c oxidase subunit 2A [Chitinophagaceae bacterium]